MKLDNSYMKEIMHELHKCPELGFDLPRTVAIVKRELEAIGIPYTEKYAPSSLVCEINPECEKFTIAIRADMDALPITEASDVPYPSEIPGQMHACGHDGHTSVLLGTVKALYEMRDQITCRVRFIFQPSEERLGGARKMIASGVMDGVDVILALHVGENPSGTLGFTYGPSMAAASAFNLEFFGHATHAAMPQNGKDALAAAVKAYSAIKIMTATEIPPLEPFVCSISALHAGTTSNIISEHASMLGTVRVFRAETNEFIRRRMDEIAAAIASEMGITYKLDYQKQTNVVINHPKVTALMEAAAIKVVGKENVGPTPQRLGGEDFSFYGDFAPSVLFRLGNFNEAKGCIRTLHNSDFKLDDDILHIGAEVFVQFVLDNMNGINFDD